MAATVTPARRAQAAPAEQSPDAVAENDPSIATDWIWYRSTDGVEINAYLAWPASAAMNASAPGVTICHQNRGLQLHIRDVAIRGRDRQMSIRLIARAGVATATAAADVRDRFIALPT